MIFNDSGKNKSNRDLLTFLAVLSYLWAITKPQNPNHVHWFEVWTNLLMCSLGFFFFFLMMLSSPPLHQNLFYGVAIIFFIVQALGIHSIALEEAKLFRNERASGRELAKKKNTDFIDPHRPNWIRRALLMSPFILLQFINEDSGEMYINESILAIFVVVYGIRDYLYREKP